MLANFSNLITFSRGSNATVTDASGRLTYAASNVLSNSQTFEAAAWTKGGVTVTANSAAAPDGTTTADKLVENTSTSSHNASQTVTIVSGAIYANSVYAKADGRNWVCLEGGSGAGGYSVWFNLATGAVGTVSGTAVSNVSISDAGNGWYRCSVLDTTTSTTGIYRIFVCDADNNQSYTGDGTSGILLWGAQLEAVTYQTTPSPYVSTSVANLLGFSEDFTNAAWTKQRASIVPNAAQNPINGLWTAQKLMEDTTASNTHRVLSALITMPSGILSTVSVYMKAAERTWGYITDAGVTNSGAYVNLATGEFGTIAGGVTRSSIQSVGNGWYRVSISGYLAGTLSQLFVSVATSNGNFSYTGDGNSGIYIYGAQLSNSGSLDPYVPTPGAAPSSTAYYGPRFDYDPVTLAAKGILIEEQRTNNFTYSQSLNNAYWTRLGMTITEDQVTAPDGTLTADKCEVTANEREFSGPNQIATFAIGATAAWSIYAKKGNVSTWPFRVSTAGAAIVAYDATFNFDTGAFSGVTSGLTASAVNMGSGWYRLSFVLTVPASTTSVKMQWRTYLNNVSGVGDFAYFWGAQAETGSFATSYIPTVASQVTRSADVASITGSLFSQWFNPNEGAVVVEAVAARKEDFPVLTGYRTPGTASFLYVNSANAGSWNGSVAVSQTGGGIASGTTFKAAMTYSPTGRAVTSGGGAPASDSNTIGAAALLSLGMPGSGPGGGQVLNGYIRSIQYIPNAISNTQLQSLTAS